MQQCRNGFRWALAFIMFAAVSVAAKAQSSIELTFDQGWVTGTAIGLPPWPFNFTLEGSFAKGSTAVLSFDSAGNPSLVVTPGIDPLHPPLSQWYGLSFAAGGMVPTAIGTPSAHATYEVPTLNTLDNNGRVLASAAANGLIPSGIGTPASNVPEPGTTALMLCGLAGVAALAGRRRPVGRPCP